MNLFKRGEAAKVLTLEVAWTERGYRMLKVLVFCLVALSVANTATAGNTCNSAINAVPVILLVHQEWKETQEHRPVENSFVPD